MQKQQEQQQQQTANEMRKRYYGNRKKKLQKKINKKSYLKKAFKCTLLSWVGLNISAKVAKISMEGQ